MFTNNWFEITGIKNFEKYLSLLPAEAGDKYLEIGCYEGQASVWIMTNTKADLTVIDTFEGSREHNQEFEKTLLDRFTANIEPYKDRVKVLIGTSREKLKTLEANQYSFIYIDGSHQASDVLEDAVLAFPLLKEGGIMIFDDYTWGVGMGYYEIPMPGIDAFVSVYGDQLKVLEKNAQVIIMKLATRPQ